MKNKIFIFVILLMGFSVGVQALVLSSAEGASCFEDCMNATACTASADDSYCSAKNSRCQTDCLLKVGQKSYGAIAYSRKDGGYGYSDSKKSRHEAEKVAMDYCKQHGKKCKDMVWFYNSCGAVAADGRKTGWGQDNEEYYARQKALKDCGRKNCEVKVVHCSK